MLPSLCHSHLTLFGKFANKRLLNCSGWVLCGGGACILLLDVDILQMLQELTHLQEGNEGRSDATRQGFQ